MPKLKEIGVGVENVNARDYVGQAQAAERLGFHSFWVPEDCVFPGAFSSGAAIATATSRIKIGTGVINPYTRHPVLIAMELAALDQLSGGRATLGLGASLRLWIEEQMGIGYAKSLSALRDAVTIIRRLLAGGEVDYQGRVFRASAGMRLNLEPERPAVPIYLATMAPKAVELTGEVADGWIPFGGEPAAVSRGMAHIRRGAVRAGRSLADFDYSAFLLTAVAEDDRAAREAVKPMLATTLAWMANQPQQPMFTDYGLTPEDAEVMRQSYARGELRPDFVSDAMVDELVLAGSPQRCREQLAARIEAGLTSAVFFMAGGPEFAKNLEELHRNVIRDFI